MNSKRVTSPILASSIFGLTSSLIVPTAFAASINVQPTATAYKSAIAVDNGTSSFSVNYNWDNYINGAWGADFEQLIGTSNRDKVNVNSGDSKFVDTGDGVDQVAVYYDKGHVVNTGAGNDRVLMGFYAQQFIINAGDGDDSLERPSYLFDVNGATVNADDGHDIVDVLFGTANAYNLGDGNDILIRDEDENTVQQKADGGAGNDEFQLIGNRSSYTVADNRNGTYAITKGSNVSIEVKSIEKLAFDDGNMYIANNSAALIPFSISDASGGETVTASVSASKGTVVVDDISGVVIFKPATNFTGTAVVTIKLNSGGNVIDSATSTVTVTGSLSSNNVNDDYAILVETNSALTASETLSGSYTAETISGTYGELTISSSGSWTFTADSALDYLAQGSIITEAFTVSPSAGGSKDINITVIGTDDAAVFNIDATASISSSSGSSSYTQVYGFDNYINGSWGADNEYITGTSNKDKINMNSGNMKVVDTGDGHDQINMLYSNGHTVNAGGGNDKIVTGSICNNYTVNAGDGDDYITQPDDLYQSQNIVINAGNGHDLVDLYAGSGITYNLGGGNDIITRHTTKNSLIQNIDGSSGDDELVLNGNYANYTVTNIGNGIYSITSGSSVSLTVEGIETVTFDDQAISLTVPTRADIAYEAYDPDGSVSIASSVSASQGSVVVNEAKGRIEFYPGASFSGSTTVTTTMTDEFGTNTVKTTTVTQ